VVETASLDTSLQHPRIQKWVEPPDTTLKHDFATSMTRMDKYAG
jgi:hypothetical protein